MQLLPAIILYNKYITTPFGSWRMLELRKDKHDTTIDGEVACRHTCRHNSPHKFSRVVIQIKPHLDYWNEGTHATRSTPISSDFFFRRPPCHRDTISRRRRRRRLTPVMQMSTSGTSEPNPYGGRVLYIGWGGLVSFINSSNTNRSIFNVIGRRKSDSTCLEKCKSCLQFTYKITICTIYIIIMCYFV